MKIPHSQNVWVNLGGALIGALVIMMVIGAIMARLQTGPDASPPDDAVPAADYSSTPPEEVRYEVTGSVTKTADITYATATGTSQQSDADLPLTDDYGNTGLTFPYAAGQFVYILAQNDEEYGSVTCSIYVDGDLVSSNTADGAYAIATCEGS